MTNSSLLFSQGNFNFFFFHISFVQVANLIQFPYKEKDSNNQEKISHKRFQQLYNNRIFMKESFIPQRSENKLENSPGCNIQQSSSIDRDILCQSLELQHMEINH